LDNRRGEYSNNGSKRSKSEMDPQKKATPKSFQVRISVQALLNIDEITPAKLTLLRKIK
jgi:hypothetical protein